MKSILIGNGLNIQFGGDDYKASPIVNRLTANIRRKKYDILFDYSVDSSSLLKLLDDLVDSLMI